MKIASTDTGVPQAQPSFNQDTFLARVNNELGQVLDLIELFLEIYPDSLRRIEAAVRQQDAESIRETAHKFKGSLQFVHAEPAVMAAQRLERICDRRQVDEAAAAFDELVLQIQQLGRDLQAFLAAADR